MPQRPGPATPQGRPLALPAACAGRLVLTASDFDAGGAAELYRRPAGGWRIVWAQPLRGRRPWTSSGSGG